MNVSDLATLCATAQVRLYAPSGIAEDRIARAIELQSANLLERMDDDSPTG